MRITVADDLVETVRFRTKHTVYVKLKGGAEGVAAVREVSKWVLKAAGANSALNGFKAVCHRP